MITANNLAVIGQIKSSYWSKVIKMSRVARLTSLLALHCNSSGSVEGVVINL